MAGIAMDRKRKPLVGADVLLLLAIAVLVLSRNTQASAGPLEHTVELPVD